MASSQTKVQPNVREDAASDNGLDYTPKPLNAAQTIKWTAGLVAGGAAILTLLWLASPAT